MAILKQSTAYTRMVLLIQSSDHITGLTGAAPTVTLSKAGAAFGALGGSVAEVSSGWYKISLNTTDTNTLGDLAYHITATSADPTDFADQVAANILGDTLPANVTQVNGSAAVTTSAQLGVAVVAYASGQAPLQPTTASRSLNVTTTGEAGINWGDVVNQATTVSLSNTTISASTAPPTAAAIATAVWQDATAGDFTTAGSIGKSLFTGGVAPGGANGLFIAGTNAATTVTTALTTTFTGNLTGSVGSVTGAVGSVTGAVGSVTGNVGGNVVGSVASVAGNVGGNVVGSVASVTGAVGSVMGNVGGNITGSIGSLAAQAKADVNAEVVDGLSVDTYAEPGQGAPPATATIADKVGYTYKAWLNKSTQTATEYDLYNNAGTVVDQKATVSDNGTVFTRGTVGTGP